MISSVGEAYKKELTKMSMKALMTRPTVANDNKIAAFYWNTSGNTASTQVVPYQNGFKTFTSAEDHYLYYTTISDDILYDLRNKITSKGYGDSGVSYFATEATWREFKALNTWAADTQSMFEVADGFFTQRNGNKYITVSVGEMPDNYILALDTTQKTLYRRVPSNPLLKGLFTPFNNVSEAKAFRRLDYKIVETGVGVAIRGSGSLAYVASGASAYVNPTFYNA